MNKKIRSGAPNGVDFTREVPEQDTLLSIASRQPVKVFELEGVATGNVMIFAHFDYDGAHHLYQSGESAASSHLFFWFCTWFDAESAEDVALKFFDGEFVLRQP